IAIAIYHVLLSLYSVCATSFISIFKDTSTTEIYTLSLHDALPISLNSRTTASRCFIMFQVRRILQTKKMKMTKTIKIKSLKRQRSEEHTSELQSRFDLVCRLLLEKKKYSFFMYLFSNSRQV